MNSFKLIRLVLVLAICLSAESKLFKKKQANSFVLIEKLQNAKILIDDVMEGEYSSTVTNKLDMAITRLYHAQLVILFDDNDNEEETNDMIDFLQGIQSLIEEAKSQIDSNSNVTYLKNANKYIQEVERVFLL